MPSQEKIPTTWVSDTGIGSVAWSGPENAASDNNVNTSAVLSAGAISNYLKGTNCAFDAFDQYALITQVKAKVRRSKSGPGSIYDYRARMVIGDVVDTQDLSNVNSWNGVETEITYSFTSGLPTAAQILASDFGFVLSTRNTSGADSGTCNVDIGSIEVTYTAVAAPTVSSVSANSGPAAGGTNVTITGTDFVATPTVTFGGSSATNVVRVNATTLTCTTPAHAAGAVDVVVTNPDTQTGTGTNAFTYLADSSVATQSVAAAPANVSPSSSCYSGFGSGSGFGI